MKTILEIINDDTIHEKSNIVRNFRIESQYIRSESLKPLLNRKKGFQIPTINNNPNIEPSIMPDRPQKYPPTTDTISVMNVSVKGAHMSLKSPYPNKNMSLASLVWRIYV